MHQMIPLTDDHAYHWRGYGDYCGRCLRDRRAPCGDLTPLIDKAGVQCRACGRLLRSSHHTDQARLARIRTLTGADQAAPTLADVDQPRERYGLPPARAALRDPSKGRVA
jgi:hypothetical protein